MTNSPFHDPQDNPLPDAKDIEQTAANSIHLYSLDQKDDIRGPSAHINQDIRRLRNAIIWLLVIGALLGGLLSIVAGVILRRIGLLDPPEPVQQNVSEQSSRDLEFRYFGSVVTPAPALTIGNDATTDGAAV